MISSLKGLPMDFKENKGYPFRKRYQRLLSVFCCLLITAACKTITEQRDSLRSPLEQSGYRQLTQEEQRNAFLQRLTIYPTDNPAVKLRTIGITIEDRPIQALLIDGPKTKTKTLRVMLVAAQHGNEISGSEALLVMAGNWVSGRDRARDIENMEILMVPAANPDGIANKRRVNAQGINLSTDYGVLRAPESTAVNKLLLEFKPDVVLDIHESALLKKKTLGAEGWLTDFEAQFECANNPNVNGALRRFTASVMLPEIIAAVQNQGLAANHYIGEITRTHQVITHGGLSAHNFRNKAGLLGAASFLVENRLDVSTGVYSTPRNIKERVRKQILSIKCFLLVCQRRLDQLKTISDQAREHCGNTRQIALQPVYVGMPEKQRIDIPLRSISTGNLVMHQFEYRGVVSSGPEVASPQAYLFCSKLDYFEDWLRKQGVPFHRGRSNQNRPCLKAVVQETNGCLLPLYLEKESASSILKRLPFDGFTDIRISKED